MGTGKMLTNFLFQRQNPPGTQHASIQGADEDPEAACRPLQEHPDPNPAAELRAAHRPPQPSWTHHDCCSPHQRCLGVGHPHIHARRRKQITTILNAKTRGSRGNKTCNKDSAYHFLCRTCTAYG
jgi:hypothetical protein